MTIEPVWYVGLAFILFAIGLIGVMIRRNAIIMLMCVELMLNGANLAFAAYSRVRTDMAGQTAMFFVMGLAAAEAAVGLALVVAVYRHLKTLNVDRMTSLRSPTPDASVQED